MTGSAAAAGLTFFVFAVGSLGGPLGGVLVDRVRRRPLLIVGNLATALVVLSLLLVRGPGGIWLIYLVMVLYGFSASVLGSAGAAMLQALVPADVLGEANSLVQTVQQGMRLVTPLLGAGLIAVVGAVPVILGDAVSFLVAVATLLLVRLREQRPVPTEQHWLAEALAGARHLARSPVLRQVTVAGVLAVIGFGLSETVVFALVDAGLHLPDAFVGTVVSAEGVGAVLAGVVAPALLRRVGVRGLVGLGALLGAVGYALMALPLLGVVLAGCALLGASMPWMVVGINTALQRDTPAALMGRADAALGLALSVPQTVAIAAGAAAVAVLDHRVLLVAMALLGVGAAGYLWRAPRALSPAASASPSPGHDPAASPG